MTCCLKRVTFAYSLQSFIKEGRLFPEIGRNDIDFQSINNPFSPDAGSGTTRCQ